MKMHEILKRLCGLYGVEQQQLASVLGVSVQTMSNFFRGRTEMRMKSCIAAFAYFGIRPTEDFETAVLESLHSDTRVPQ